MLLDMFGTPLQIGDFVLHTPSRDFPTLYLIYAFDEAKHYVKVYRAVSKYDSSSRTFYRELKKVSLHDSDDVRMLQLPPGMIRSHRFTQEEIDLLVEKRREVLLERPDLP